MPVQASSRPIDVPMRSFMSVYAEASNSLAPPQDHTRVNGHGEDAVNRPSTSGSGSNNSHSANPAQAAFAAFHQHRDSTSTSASESTDSSPTTTISTLESSSMTEPSPGPSPESPGPKNQPSRLNTTDVQRPRSQGHLGEASSANGADGQNFFELQRPTTPAKRPKNLKGLAVDTSSAVSFGRAVSTASLPLGAPAPAETTLSAPPSPSFVKPPTPPRRKSNLGLTIQTPGNTILPGRLAIPPTPAFKPKNMLRHFQSSPSLNTEMESKKMNFPPRPARPAPMGFAEVPLEDEEDEQPNFDVPQSREDKPEAYPNGPIRIYESGVYLYYEPSAEVAADFDVIFNVASEVRNPFTSGAKASRNSARIPEEQPNEFAVSSPSDSEDSLVMSDDDSQKNTPTTPKATPQQDSGRPSDALSLASARMPEYIHMPWEHNTDIVPDLHKLVKVIDDRVQQGKKVLVHCQCGVSRSASLIVAYGLYKNAGLTVQEAYDAVKKRSKWIGPNMNLIMQLQEFRSSLLRMGSQSFTSPLMGLNIPRSSNTASSLDRHHSPLEIGTASNPRTPRTAPLPPDLDPATQRASTGNMAVSPGPLSAPSGYTGAWSPGFRRSWGSSQTSFDITSPTDAPSNNALHLDSLNQFVPAQTDGQTRAPTEKSAEPIPAIRKAVPNFSRQLPVRRRDYDDDEVMTDAPPLMSPQATTFATSFLSPPNPAFAEPLMSPHKTTFDIPSFGPPSDAESDELLLSPRGAQFGMIGIPTRIAPRKEPEPQDQHGMLSPTRSHFPANPFEGVSSLGSTLSSANEQQLSQPQPATVQPNPNPSAISALQTNAQRSDEQADAVQGLRMVPRGPMPQPTESEFKPEIQLPVAATTPMKATSVQEPNSTGSFNRHVSPSSQMSTPRPPRTLRTKYSSPNMATQLKLHKIQTEMEAKLPHHLPSLRAMDDTDAAMSPRVEEFTRNPFHAELVEKLKGQTKNRPSAISQEVLQETTSTNATTPEQPKVIKKSPSASSIPVLEGEEDPRSPVHAGVSPITRNIWDVL